VLATIGLVAALAASPLGYALVRDTLAHLDAWVSGTPGEQAPDVDQRGFSEANSSSYARFPDGTQVGLLVSTAVGGDQYDLLGFRDGDALCLRLVRRAAPARRDTPADCAPTRELNRIDEPAVALAAGDDFSRDAQGEIHAMLVVYGLATNDVAGVTVEDDHGQRHGTTVRNNAFLYVGPPGGRTSVARLIVTTDEAAVAEIPVATTRPETGHLPGPTTIERKLDSDAIGWLDRREPRGEPFTWPDPDETEQKIQYARLLEPEPGRSFQLGIATAEGAAWPIKGRWYCTAWLWPLISRTFTSGCIRREAIAGDHLSLMSVIPGRGIQFPLFVALVPDEVASLELYFADGSREPVPIVDNAVVFQLWLGEAAKLVAYDREHRVVAITDL
jgi:hypothetical protein